MLCASFNTVHASTATHASDAQAVLVLGDSLSAAYGMPAEEGWVSLMQARIEEQNLSAKVVNASVSGATTAAGLQVATAALQEHQPSLVILQLGANDGLQGKPLNYIRQNLIKLITKCKQAGAEIVLLGVRIPPNYGDAYAIPFFEQYAELAEEYELALVPFFLDGIAGNPELMMTDGLHPRSLAQPIVLDNVWPTLMPFLTSDEH